MAREVGPGPPDRRIAALAARQWGLVTRGQLLALGLDHGAIDARMAAGRLHVVHRGVYAVGHPVLGLEGRLLAALLAVGPGAVLSHRTAAAWWEVRAARGSAIDVTTPRRSRWHHSGVIVHRPRRLDPADVTTHRDFPVTTVARTVLDLAEVTDLRSTRRALEQCEIQGLLDLDALHDVLSRANGRRGAPVLRRALALYEPVGDTRSVLERRMLRLCRRERLPRPLVNVLVEGYEVDFLWRRRRLVAETDGRAVHATHEAFERDRARDAALTAAGYRVVRFSYRQVTGRPDAVAATLRALLGGPGPTSP